MQAARKPRIVLIDDDRFVRRLVENTLRQIGKMDVTLAATGLEGIASIEANVPDLVLLDSVMPVMSGPDTLRCIRKSARAARIPVAFLTAASGTKEAAYYESLGAAATIRKPFIPGSLVDKVNQILAARSPDCTGSILAEPGYAPGAICAA